MAQLSQCPLPAAFLEIQQFLPNLRPERKVRKKEISFFSVIFYRLPFVVTLVSTTDMYFRRVGPFPNNSIFAGTPGIAFTPICHHRQGWWFMKGVILRILVEIKKEWPRFQIGRHSQFCVRLPARHERPRVSTACQGRLQGLPPVRAPAWNRSDHRGMIFKRTVQPYVDLNVHRCFMQETFALRWWHVRRPVWVHRGSSRHRWRHSDIPKYQPGPPIGLWRPDSGPRRRCIGLRNR